MRTPTSQDGGLPAATGTDNKGGQSAADASAATTTPKPPKTPKGKGKGKKKPAATTEPRPTRTVRRFSLLQWVQAKEKELDLPIGLALKAMPVATVDQLRAALSAKPLSFEDLTMKRDDLAKRLRAAEIALVSAGNSGSLVERLTAHVVSTARGIREIADRTPVLPLNAAPADAPATDIGTQSAPVS